VAQQVEGEGLDALIEMFRFDLTSLDGAIEDHVGGVLAFCGEKVAGAGSCRLVVAGQVCAHDHTLASGFQQAFWWSVVFTAIAVPVCRLLPGRPEPTQAKPAGATPARDQAADRT